MYKRLELFEIILIRMYLGISQNKKQVLHLKKIKPFSKVTGPTGEIDDIFLIF